jgi:hypothetical protein
MHLACIRRKGPESYTATMRERSQSVKTFSGLVLRRRASAVSKDGHGSQPVAILRDARCAGSSG